MIREEVTAIMESHWEAQYGYCVPNRSVYPLQWLWDSCFHAIIWASLGDERALIELRTVFDFQTDSGFVPHMGYQRDPEDAVRLWGHRGSSIITQPPMYGHAAAELHRRGIELDPKTVESIGRALDCLWSERRTRSGLLSVFHPWETGLDDTPRWDDWCGAGFDRKAWAARKREFIQAIERSPKSGMAIGNPLFDVCPVSFNALYAFNCIEYANLVDDARYSLRAAEILELIDAQWDEARGSWTDTLPDGTSEGSLTTRTLDALLPVLGPVEPTRVARVLDAITSDEQFGGMYGPATVHRGEPVFNPSAYWRGSAWAQINYLLWVAAHRHEEEQIAKQLAGQTVAAARRSGYAEYWNPDTAEGLGAIPQTWTCLAFVMSMT